ncbi:MAG: hypothetical protein KAI24_19200, partial [Planctomycetes bacterium]|nr:hypothetical protein [Planctomycetota bacterium]
MAFASIAAAQTVWTVPPGQPVGPTIAAASPGDIIQLSGTHPVFDLDKGLTVRGPATIEPSATLPAPIETSVDIPAGQVASFEQLVFQASYNSSGGHGGRVVVDGELSCEDCSFDAVTGQLQGTVELRTGVLALQRCDLQGVGGGAGLAILGGTCSAVDCTFAGASDGFWWPAPAIDVRGGVLMAAGITATGGYGGSLNGAFLPGQAGLRRTAGRAVVVDSELRGGVTFGPGGPAIAATTGVTIARTVLVDAALSPPSSGFTVDPDLPGIEISGPLATGA